MKLTFISLLLLAFMALPAAARTVPGGFDFASRTVRLNDGTVMPIVGLGTYSLSGAECERSIAALLAAAARASCSPTRRSARSRRRTA